MKNIVIKFVHLERITSFEIGGAKMVVSVLETGERLGQGWRICNIRFIKGSTEQKNLLLQIVLNTKNNEEEVYINDVQYSDIKLKNIRFDLSNQDF